MRIHELGHVVLFVSNLERVGNFYRDILGFQEIARKPGMALFGAGRTHHELLLIEVGGAPVHQPNGTPGLYHIGFNIGNSPKDARRAYKELTAQGIPIVGTGDHTVTHSIYILDPDGNEIELYANVSDAWKTDPQAILSPVKPLKL